MTRSIPALGTYLAARWRDSRPLTERRPAVSTAMALMPVAPRSARAQPRPVQRPYPGAATPCADKLTPAATTPRHPRRGFFTSAVSSTSPARQPVQIGSETAGRNCARGSHGYTARRPSTTNLHEASYGLRCQLSRDQLIISYGIYPSSNVIVEVTDRAWVQFGPTRPRITGHDGETIARSVTGLPKARVPTG